MDTQIPFDRLMSDRRIMEFVTDKRLSAKSYMKYMTIRLLRMFKYENLPETIPQEMLEYYLIINGSCFITKVNSKLYAFIGGFGGEPDVYYRPTRYTVSNPALSYSGTHKIEDESSTTINDHQFAVGSEGVLIRNDPLWQGLAPLMARYATLLSENILTIRTADIMLRAIAYISAPDDKTRLSAETFLKKLEKGELGVIGESPFFEGVKLQSPPSNNGSYLTQFIELHQYLKGSFYNEIGLNANFNMKREALNQGETTLNEDSLIPLVESMLKCRQEDMAKVSELFQLDPPITVDFDSAWAQNVRENEAQLEKIENEAISSQLPDSADNSDSSEGSETDEPDVSSSEGPGDSEEKREDDASDD